MISPAWERALYLLAGVNAPLRQARIARLEEAEQEAIRAGHAYGLMVTRELLRQERAMFSRETCLRDSYQQHNTPLVRRPVTRTSRRREPHRQCRQHACRSSSDDSPGESEPPGGRQQVGIPTGGGD